MIRLLRPVDELVETSRVARKLASNFAAAACVEGRDRALEQREHRAGDTIAIAGKREHRPVVRAVRRSIEQTYASGGGDRRRARRARNRPSSRWSEAYGNDVRCACSWPCRTRPRPFSAMLASSLAVSPRGRYVARDCSWQTMPALPVPITLQQAGQRRERRSRRWQRLPTASCRNSGQRSPFAGF